MNLLTIPVPTEWIHILTKPVRSGYYDLLTVDGEIERRYFNVVTGNWLCVSGTEPHTIYTFWRGLTAPLGVFQA